jgi:hypothetical protein
LRFVFRLDPVANEDLQLLRPLQWLDGVGAGPDKFEIGRGRKGLDDAVECVVDPRV